VPKAPAEVQPKTTRSGAVVLMSSAALGRSSRIIRISASRVTSSRKIRVVLTISAPICRWKSGSITVLEDGTIRPMRKGRTGKLPLSFETTDYTLTKAITQQPVLPERLCDEGACSCLGPYPQIMEPRPRRNSYRHQESTLPRSAPR
jgi:hypothetical protein